MSATVPVIAATSPIPTLNREELLFCLGLLALCGVFGARVSPHARCPRCDKRKLVVSIDPEGGKHHHCNSCCYGAVWCQEWTPPNPTLRDPADGRRYHRTPHFGSKMVRISLPRSFECRVVPVGDCIDGLRFGECAVCDAEAKPTKKKYPRNGRRLEFVIWGRRVLPKKQDGFEIISVIPDKEQVYDPDHSEILGVPIHPGQHGLTDWIDQQHKPTTGRRFSLFKNGDVVKARLHRDEVLELEKSRRLKVKGNSGGGRPLRASEEEAAVYREELQPEPRTEREAEQRDLQNLVAESKQPVYWDGEEFQFLEDQEYFPGQVVRRGRGRNKTDDERLAEAQAWETVCQVLQEKLRAGEGWSPTDLREHDRVLPNGVRINLENRRVREILYEIDSHWKNYDTKEQLAEAYGLSYETLRKRDELMSMNANKTCPQTPFTKEQVEHLKKKDGRAVFVHVVADRPRWFILDMDKHDTYQDAIQAIKREGVDEALRKTPMWQNDRAPKNKHTAALKEVWARWNEWFRPANLYVLDLRSPLSVAIAEEAWEAET